MGFLSGYSAVEPQLGYVDDCRDSAKDMLLKIDLRIGKVVSNSFAGLSIYLNLMRSDVGDCGNPGCSFVDSSSERDAA